jgi:hypothetical protein
VVAAMFTPDPTDPARLIHDRLEAEREKQAEWSKKSSDAGKESARLRAEAKARLDQERLNNAQPEVNQTSTTVQPPLPVWLPNGTSQNPTLQSSSSFPNKEEEKRAGAQDFFSEPAINPKRSGHCPTWDEVLRYTLSMNGAKEQAKAFFEYNEKMDWRNYKGQPIPFWQSMVSTWLSNDAEKASKEAEKRKREQEKQEGKNKPKQVAQGLTAAEIYKRRQSQSNNP